MPNHVSSDLWISGPTTEVKKFIEFAKTKEKGEENVLDTNKFIPYPKEYRDKDNIAKQYIEKHGRDTAPKDGYNSGGYEWSKKHWGSKWGIYNAELVDESEFQGETTAQYGFDTAWSPCMPVVTKMGEMFPKLDFRYCYFECGCQFNGQLIIEKGEVKSEETGDYFGDRGG